MLRFNVSLKLDNKRIPIKFSKNSNSFKATFSDFQTVLVPPDPYTGDYEVTPKPVEQTLNANGKYMLSDIVVKAIPQEYGLVTYDQSKTITVS